MAARAALTARPSPVDEPMPMMAVPALVMIIFTSAKSVLISPGTVMRSVMPCTPCRRTSSAILKALTMVVLSLDTVSSRSFGMTMRVSTFSLRIWIPFSACTARRRPSKVNGRVTTPMVSAPSALAISATTGAAPVPVPPPLPAVMKTMSAPFSASSISARCSSAAWRPTSGSLPAPESPGQLATDVELQVGVAHEQRLRVGVGGDELDVAQPGVDHAVDGVHSAATDADHLDDGEVVALGRHGRHDSPCLRVDRRPVVRWLVPPTVTVDVRQITDP